MGTAAGAAKALERRKAKSRQRLELARIHRQAADMIAPSAAAAVTGRTTAEQPVATAVDVDARNDERTDAGGPLVHRESMQGLESIQQSEHAVARMSMPAAAVLGGVLAGTVKASAQTRLAAAIWTLEANGIGGTQKGPKRNSLPEMSPEELGRFVASAASAHGLRQAAARAETVEPISVSDAKPRTA
jgi:hypothetical protein